MNVKTSLFILSVLQVGQAKIKKKISTASEKISTDYYKRNAKNKPCRARRVWFYTMNKEEIQGQRNGTSTGQEN